MKKLLLLLLTVVSTIAFAHDLKPQKNSILSGSQSHDVTIGRHFHWEQQQEQTFTGILRLIVDGGKILAIDELPVEDYLESVIASEMSASSHPELL